MGPYERYQKLKKNPAFMFGLPFLVFMCGGSFLLSYFTQIRYDKYDRTHRTLDKQEVLNLEADEKLTEMRKEFKTILESTKKDDWEQHRITRPWEEEAKN